MSALTPPALEQLLALTLARVQHLERALTAANLRVLQAETARDVALDDLAAVDVSQELRHQSAQAICDMRNAAHSLKSAGRPTIASGLEQRALYLQRALAP